MEWRCIPLGFRTTSSPRLLDPLLGRLWPSCPQPVPERAGYFLPDSKSGLEGLGEDGGGEEYL